MIYPIQFQSVTYQYSPNADVLREISLQIAEGSVSLLIGQNGAGKSTLLRLLNGILRPTVGEVFANGLRTSEFSTARLAREVSVTFQNPGNQIFESTVEKEIAFGPRNLRLANKDTIVRQAAAMFGLTDALASNPYDLSPSARKLLTIASAVAMQTHTLAFDEPSAGLSHPERIKLIQALSELRRIGRTLIIITHDVDLFFPLVDRVLLLARGTIGFDGSVEEFISHQRSLRRLGAELPLAMRVERMLKEYNAS
jgi:energy-coupling factor transport system ATP-binding protein